MILLDTHVWVWWVGQQSAFAPRLQHAIQASREDGLGVSIISCWEVAKLVEVGRLRLSLSVTEWLDQALSYRGVQLLDLTVPIAVESTQLPGRFHRDPADQIIVATARTCDIRLLTVDEKILAYPHVKLVL